MPATMIAPFRYHVRVWLEGNDLCTTSLLPSEVAETISAAARWGLTHGTVYYERRYRGLEATTAELYCWEKE